MFRALFGDYTAVANRLVELEHRVILLERNNKQFEDMLVERCDEAFKALLPEVAEKCFVKVYNKEMLVRLLDLADKAKEEENE